MHFVIRNKYFFYRIQDITWSQWISSITRKVYLERIFVVILKLTWGNSHNLRISRKHFANDSFTMHIFNAIAIVYNFLHHDFIAQNLHLKQNFLCSVSREYWCTRHVLKTNFRMSFKDTETKHETFCDLKLTIYSWKSKIIHNLPISNLTHSTSHFLLNI